MTQTTAHSPARVLLLGNPNAGKSTLFAALTRSHAHIGNYPGLTVESRQALTRPGLGPPLSIVDVPGVYSLTPRSQDEVLTTAWALGARGRARAAAVVVVDATSLARGLYLCAQVLELALPVVVALTCVDRAHAAGRMPDVAALEKALGVPVVPVHAARGAGLTALVSALHIQITAGARPARPTLQLPACMQAELERVTTNRPPLARARAVLALSLPHELEAQAAFCDLDVALLALHTLDPAQRGALAAACITARYRWVDALVAACLPPPPPARPSRTARLDGWLTHPLWGTAFFVCIMGLLFSLLFTGTEPLMQLIELGVTRLQELAVQRMPPGSLRELLADGVIGGVGNVLVFLPQITALFLAVQVLEDSGYLARVVVLADGLLRRLGLQGRAFVPFLAAFACAVPAVLATRTLSRRRDRLLVMMTLPLTSCSARLPVYLLVLATVFAPETRVLGVLPVSVLWLGGLYALSLGAALIAAAVLQRTLLPGQAAPLVIELPSYRLPHLGTTWRGVWVRVRAFLLGAGTLILAMTILLWALMYFPRPPAALGADAASTHVPAPQSAAERAHSRGKPSPGDVARPQGKPSKAAAVRPGSGSVLAAERVTAPAPSDAAGTALAHSYAGRLGRALGPLWVPLGFDWRLGIGIIAAFSAREVFVSTLAIVFGVEGDDAHIAPLRDALRRARKADGTPLMTPVTGLALMVFFLFCCQCMSTLAVVYRESGALRWPVLLFVYMTGLAYALAWLVRQIGLMWGFS